MRDKLGQRILPSGIDIVDDPLRRRGQRSRPFDAEGVTTRTLKLVDDGVLKTWLLDCATARELNLVNHRARPPRRLLGPSPGPSNLYLDARQQSPEELIADIADGFYVTDLIGMGANMVTGDYSRGASGFWIENGVRTYAVSEVTIAGNMNEMFAGPVARQRSGVPLRHQRADVRLEGLTVAGH